jgi:hypothetical protein
MQCRQAAGAQQLLNSILFVASCRVQSKLLAQQPFAAAFDWYTALDQLQLQQQQQQQP